MCTQRPEHMPSEQLLIVYRKMGCHFPSAAGNESDVIRFALIL